MRPAAPIFDPYLDGTAASSDVAASPDNPVNATYPFTDLPQVTTPNPRGFFDPDHYHQLESDQIASLLDCAPDPAQFNRYAFAPQQFTDFYQCIASGFVLLCNQFPPASANKRAG
jgi:hypothetical protein